jgi:integrase
MKGCIQRRGKMSFRLKFEAAERDPVTGKRKTKYQTFRGTRKEAQVKLAELVAAVGRGTYVEPTKLTVAEFIAARIKQWEAAPEGISTRTAERYRDLLKNQIAPRIGNKVLQALKPIDIEGWHAALHTTDGYSARTISHAHRLLSQALRDAVKNDLVVKNAATVHKAPKLGDHEAVIVQDVPGLVEKLKGHPLQAMAMIALFAGLRLGEVMALRWSRIDLDKKTLQVREALEQTKQHGTRFKLPKSKAGIRDITLPDILVSVLREHRKAQLELRMKLGAGKLPDDALLFADLDGAPLSRISASWRWSDFATRIGLPDVTFPRLAPYSRQPANRRGCGHRDDCPEVRARQARHHLEDLRAPSSGRTTARLLTPSMRF